MECSAMWCILSQILLIGIVKGTESDWWRNAAIYRIYTRSFMDMDGDGVGDISGITSKIPYLKNLGIDAIWLSPILKSPLLDYGYDISDFYSIHHEYGTIEDLEHLIQTAAESEIKVILEMVPNHSSTLCEWFTRSIAKDEYYDNWYIWEKGHEDENGKKQPPNNWISVFGSSAWTYEPKRDEFYLHQFGENQPDLNYRNPVVLDEMKNVLKYWLEKKVAGIVLTSINYLFEVDKDGYANRYPNEPVTGIPGVAANNYTYLNHIYTKDQRETYEVVTQFRSVFDSLSLRDNVTRILMIEARTGIKNTVRFYDDCKAKRSHVPVNFGIIEDLKNDFDARDLKFSIDRWNTYKPLKKPANWMIGNHDTSRVASRYREELVDPFNMLVLLLPGIGILYMGEEIGMRDSHISWVDTKDPLGCHTDDPFRYTQVSRDPYRSPFQWDSNPNAGFSTADKTWLPVNGEYVQINSETQRVAVRSHLRLYKTLMRLRQRPAFRKGRFESLALHPHVFAFKRWFADDAYVVVINLGRTNHRVNLTAFDLIFGILEVEASSILSERVYGDTLQADNVEITSEEALVLRMQA